MSLFARDGYDSVGAEAIAHEAGVSLRTFYRYFAGKDDVLSPILSEGTTELADLLAARPPDESLADAVCHAYRQVNASVDPARVHALVGLLTDVPALRSRWLDSMRMVEDALAPVVQAREQLNGAQALLTAAVIVTAIRATLEQAARTHSSSSLTDDLRLALAYLGAGARLGPVAGA